MSQSKIPWKADGTFVREKGTGIFVGAYAKVEDAQFTCQSVNYHDQLCAMLKKAAFNKAARNPPAWVRRAKKLLVLIRFGV